MEYQYTEGLWRGPLIVLVDDGSASSSERFAWELQDNHAALIMGEPTAGAVGGHTDGGISTVLAHSGAVLELPDICDLPSDGRYARGGVVPDLLVGFRRGDGPHLRAAAFLAKLPEALARVKYPLKSEY
jgi:C-terminal processing protease CtpA/Prc